MSLFRRAQSDDLVASAICLMIGTFVLYATLDFPRPKGVTYGGGPAFYPQLLAIVLIGLGGLLLIGAVFQFKKTSIVIRQTFQQKEKKRYFLIPLMIASSVLSIYLIQFLGFLIGGSIFLMSSILMIRPAHRLRELISYGTVVVGITISIYIIFELLINVPLPRPTLF